ncbi:remorin isoform X2 [Senna tora]|uniref:Remorin isoform X2 n=1 Tax=Senna tora TaxID=362788 RepID=A0A834X542_9FABA|nr:remorin isoform X2 [Senna tora]
MENRFKQTRVSSVEEYGVREEEHATAVAAAAFAIHSIEEEEAKSLNAQKLREEGPTFSSSKTMRRKQDSSLSRPSSYGRENAFAVRRPSGIPSPKPLSPAEAGGYQKQRGSPIPIKHNNVKTRAEAWEKAKMERIHKRYEKIKSKILSWEREQKMQAKLSMERKSLLEHRRAIELQQYQNKIARIEMIAHTARAQMEDKKRKEEFEITLMCSTCDRTQSITQVVLIYMGEASASGRGESRDITVSNAPTKALTLLFLSSASLLAVSSITLFISKLACWLKFESPRNVVLRLNFNHLSFPKTQLPGWNSFVSCPNYCTPFLLDSVRNLCIFTWTMMSCFTALQISTISFSMGRVGWGSSGAEDDESLGTVFCIRLLIMTSEDRGVGDKDLDGLIPWSACLGILFEDADCDSGDKDDEAMSLFWIRDPDLLICPLSCFKLVSSYDGESKDSLAGSLARIRHSFQVLGCLRNYA